MEISEIAKLIKTESRMVVARAGGGGNEELLTNGLKFQLSKMSKF